MLRRFTSALIAALVAITAAVVLASSPPALAETVDLDLEMVPGGGALELRDADEPFALSSPTAVTGTYDDQTGAITGATFSTPTVTFELPVLGGALTAVIEATITEVAPGTSTGSVDPDGNVSFQTSVTVDLHIVVEDADIDDRCQSTPVNLELFSTSPYANDPDAEGPLPGDVTLRDPDFVIPPVPVTETCHDLVADNANPMLAGSGHSVSLAMEGAITLPPDCDIDTATTFEVSPADGAALGEEVTMTATVVPDSVGDDPLGGAVEFRSGTKVVGEGTITAGVATATTSTLALGDHNLTANYRGDSTYCKSSSDPTAYTISANPVFEVSIPSSVKIGAAPTVFPVTLENPSVGRAINNTRLDFTIQRGVPGDFNNDALDPADVLLEREGPTNVWTPVTLDVVAATASTLTGTIGPDTGQPLAPGASLTENLRISFPTGSPATLPGLTTVTFDAVQVAPTDGAEIDTVASTHGPLVIRNTARAATTTTFEVTAPPWTRAGGTLITDVTTQGANTTATYRTKGPLRLYVDGVPVRFWVPGFGGGTEPQFEATYAASSLLNTYLDLPDSVGIGTHTLTAKFGGDDLFAPSQASQTFTVHEPYGTRYECLFDDAFFPQKYIVYATAEGRIPTAAVPGTPAPIEDFDLSLKLGRSFSEYFSVLVLAQPGELQTFAIDLGEHGEASAPAVTQTGDPWFGPPDDSPINFDLTLDGEEGSITMPNTPGAVITTAIHGFSMIATSGAISCEAVDEPIVLGSTVVAGTTVSVEAPTPTRADDEITIQATVAPDTATGVVDFYDGANLIGIGAIDDGVAEIDATLPAGTHSLTAKSRTGASAPSTTSEPVSLTVLPAADCGAFAVEGNGAAVRLVYMELLRRCPGQAGYDYWLDQLDTEKVTREEFANQISNSYEARGIIVDDAYDLILNRAPDAAGRDFWAKRIARNAGYDDLLAELAASAEFRNAAGDPTAGNVGTRAGFVTAIYDRLLNREPSARDLEYWTDFLVAKGAKGYRQMVVTLFDLPEPQAAIVKAAYDEILGREPSASELATSSATFDKDKNRSALYASLIDTDDFFERAQLFPNPED